MDDVLIKPLTLRELSLVLARHVDSLRTAGVPADASAS
jgi:hypothetical protein